MPGQATQPNLCLIDDHLSVQVSVSGHLTTFSLDSGAVNTDVYANFGRAFPDLIRDAAKSLVEVRGVGGSEEHSSLNLPDVELKIGPTLVTLRRAKMLTERVNSPHFVGNLGFDLLKQHGAFEIDLRAMRLELQTAEEANPKGSVQLSR